MGSAPCVTKEVAEKRLLLFYTNVIIITWTRARSFMELKFRL